MPVVSERERRRGRRWAWGCLSVGFLVPVAGLVVLALANPLTIEAGPMVYQVRHFVVDPLGPSSTIPPGLDSWDRRTFGEVLNDVLYLTDWKEHGRTLRVGDRVLEVWWFRGRKALRPVYSGGRIRAVPQSNGEPP